MGYVKFVLNGVECVIVVFLSENIMVIVYWFEDLVYCLDGLFFECCLVKVKNRREANEIDICFRE